MRLRYDRDKVSPEPSLEPELSVTSTRQVRKNRGKGKENSVKIESDGANVQSTAISTNPAPNNRSAAADDAASTRSFGTGLTTDSFSTTTASNNRGAAAGDAASTHSFGSGLTTNSYGSVRDTARRIPQDIPQYRYTVDLDHPHPPDNAKELLAMFQAFGHLPNKAGIDRNSNKKLRRFLSGQVKEADHFVVGACNEMSLLQELYGSHANVQMIAKEFQLHMFGHKDARPGNARGQRQGRGLPQLRGGSVQMLGEPERLPEEPSNHLQKPDGEIGYTMRVLVASMLLLLCFVLSW